MFFYKNISIGNGLAGSSQKSKVNIATRLKCVRIKRARRCGDESLGKSRGNGWVLLYISLNEEAAEERMEGQRLMIDAENSAFEIHWPLVVLVSLLWLHHRRLPPFHKIYRTVHFHLATKIFMFFTLLILVKLDHLKD